MILYADTSWLAKLYVKEAESDLVRSAVLSAPAVASSVITYAEMRSALARAHRLGRHTEEDHRAALGSFEQDWTGLTRVALDERLVHRAGDLAEEHGLRGYDAVHLASAVRLQDDAEEAVTFSTFDGLLRKAALACGLGAG